MMRKNVLLFTAAFLLGIGATGLGQTGPTLKKLTAFDLPGPAGKRFDYLTIDEDDHYLISAHSIEISVVLLSAVIACVCAYLGPFWALPSEFLSGASAASGIALVTTFVNAGGFVGPYVAGFIRTKTV